MKPWDPPEERLYPVLDDLLHDWTYSHPTAPLRSGSSATADRRARTR
jgi:hypothetical protein